MRAMAQPRRGPTRSCRFFTGRTELRRLYRNCRSKALAPSDGWVDEPSDANYNRPVSLPYPASAEQMWREDELYDALVVIGYNMEPVVPGAGSAIFLHIATPDFAPTAGCVAVKREILLGLLPLLGPGSQIVINS